MFTVAPAQVTYVGRHEARWCSRIFAFDRPRNEVEAVERLGAIIEVSIVNDGVRGGADDSAGGNSDAAM